MELVTIYLDVYDFKTVTKAIIESNAYCKICDVS